MPTILEETTVALEHQDLNSRYPYRRAVNKRGQLVEPARSPGVHLSGVLRYLAIEGGALKSFDEDLEEDVLPLRMALGLAWEEFAVSLYPTIDWQPGEIMHEGILMTPDGLSERDDYPELLDIHDKARRKTSFYKPSSPCLEEFKFTWKKRKTAEDFVRDSWYWLQQGRGYCWGYECRLIRWHVCYVMGDYRGGGPIYMRYLIQFSDDEIEKTANMIRLNRDRAAEKGYVE